MERDEWFTAVELEQLGYKQELLTELFGEPTLSDNGVQKWRQSVVFEVERTELAPHARKLWSTFNHPLSVHGAGPIEEMLARVNHRDMLDNLK